MVGLIQFIYGTLVALSLICATIYIFMWHKHFDVNFTMVFTLVSIACIGYLLSSVSYRMESALISLKIIYIGGCFLQFFMLFAIFNLCGIEIKQWLRALLFAVCAVLYVFVLTSDSSDVFYRNFYLKVMDGVPVLTKEYGVMHSVFYVVVISFFLTGIITIVYSLFKKKQIPRTVISLLALPNVICILSFFVLRRFLVRLDPMPFGYVLAEFVYLLISYRVNLYDVSDTVIDSMIQEKAIGYISFDFDFRYLGSNDFAKEIVPELNEVAVDEVFGYKPSERKIRHFLNNYHEDPDNNTFVYTVHDEEGDVEKDRIFNVTVNDLYDNTRKRGYIVTFTDDTANKKYIKLLDSYNEDLQKEVQEKTEHILDMHDNLIMSLAMMVESRDNSTGGHIKRTSECVRILIDEITKLGDLNLSAEFCKDIVKAAPMHDLGKIAVDDDVLRKPGKFTPEEYEKMKHHAAEGARVIHEILLHTDDNSFKRVAENIAHYHHERWDGSGYPEGLAKEAIPIEARIMAVADVYDALVSKRVYKEAFDFEKANRIIMEGMGTQFDPGLKSAYENARPRLEAYYETQ